MILESLRLIEDILEDSSYGVNAKLDSMGQNSLFGSDDQPPDIVKVLNATEDQAVVKGETGSDWPVLVLAQAAPATVDGIPSQSKRDATVPLSLAYITRESDGAKATRYALYTMRAALKALGDLFNKDADTERKMNSVYIVDITDISWAEIEESMQDGATARSAMVLTVHARDESAI